MTEFEHNVLHGTAGAHAIYRWAVANQAARFALSVVADDRGKIAWQQSDDTFWVLRVHGSVGNSGGWRQADDSAALAAAAASVQPARALTAGTGLTGGGDLSADRTFACDFGTAAGKVCQGNDSRVVGAVQTARTITAGTGLTGGGDLSADRTLACDFGSAAGKVCQGNDSRLSDARTPTAHAATHLPGGTDDANPLAAGAALTDADQTLQWSTTQGFHRMAPSTTTATRAKTLGVTNAVAGSCYVLDIYSQGNDVTIINGGAGGGTIDTITAGTKVRYVSRYDGVNWPKGVRMPLA